MHNRSGLFAVATLLALAACSESKVETQKAEASAETGVTVDITDENGGGSVELKLPGGMQAKVDVPEGMSGNSKFDIGGVGLYPGAKLGSIKVNAVKAGGDTHDATVNIGFSASADAAAVADWYHQAFEARKIAVIRTGETITGKTEDGDDFTLALTSANGGASGLLTIKDAS